MARPNNSDVPAVSASQIHLTDKRLCDLEDCRAIIFSPIRKDKVPPVEIIMPFDWNMDPYSDSNWISQLQKWNMIDKYLYNYSRSGNKKFFDVSLNVVMDWKKYFDRTHPASSIVWQDFVVGIRAMKIAFLLAQGGQNESLLEPQDVDALNSLATAHLDCILHVNEIRYTNHTFSDLHGAMALAQVVSPALREEVFDFVGTHLPILIDKQFDIWGMHREHSFQYQDVAIQCLKRLDATGWFDAFNVKSCIQRAESVRGWLRLPDGRLAPVGDTDGSHFSGEKSAQAPRFGDSVWNTSGYCIVRRIREEISNCSHLLMNGAYNSDVHKQSDFLSLIWFEGQDILVDPGKYAYKRDHFRRHVKQTRSHNTIEVDGKSYQLDSIRNYGSLIKNLSVHDWGYLLTAEADHAKISVVHRRYCLYRPGEWLVIVDTLTSDKEHSYTQWHQFSPLLKCNVSGPRWSAELLDGRKLMGTYATKHFSTVIHARGQLEPQVQGWVSEGYGSVIENDAVGVNQCGEDAVFVTLFGIDANAAVVALEEDGSLVAHMDWASDLRTYISISSSYNNTFSEPLVQVSRVN